MLLTIRVSNLPLAAPSNTRARRDQEGIAHIFKRLQYAGVILETLSEGRVTELHVGLKGTMNQMFLTELGNKTRRVSSLASRTALAAAAGATVTTWPRRTS